MTKKLTNGETLPLSPHAQAVGKLTPDWGPSSYNPRVGTWKNLIFHPLLLLGHLSINFLPGLELREKKSHLSY